MPEPEDKPIEPLGAPTDPLRPTGRIESAPTAAEAAAVRRTVRTTGRVLFGLLVGFVLLLVLGAFLVPWLLRP